MFEKYEENSNKNIKTKKNGIISIDSNTNFNI